MNQKGESEFNFSLSFSCLWSWSEGPRESNFAIEILIVEYLPQISESYELIFVYLLKLFVGMNDVAKDLFCGWLSGIGQVLTMMPFENIKIKLVSKPKEYYGYTQAITKTLREEGALSFYKGMLMNLLGVGPQVSIQFGVVETLKKYLKRNFVKGDQDLPLNLILLCGLLAGIPSATVVTPLDHARFRTALKKDGKNLGSLQMSKDILREHGFFKLYTGYASTIFRETVALATYFTTYELCKRKLLSNPKEVPIWAALLSGGISGVMTWTFSYPMDYIKTLIQTDSLENPRHKTMRGYFKEEIAKGSVKQFFVGFEIMMVRAFVVNATGFLCFEIGKKLMYRKSEA